jgi:hypothetical protein
MIQIPFTERSAAALIMAGYTLTQHPATWEDAGDAENGPKLTGGPAFDEWSKGDISIIVVNGQVEAIEKNPPEPVGYLDGCTI